MTTKYLFINGYMYIYIYIYIYIYYICNSCCNKTVYYNVILSRSRNPFRHGNTKILSLFIVGGLDATVDNIKDFSVVMEMQQWFLFAMLSINKIFRCL